MEEEEKKKTKIRSHEPAPAHSEEWLQGWAAFEEGKDKHGNPYMADTEFLKYNRWLRGWEAASYQNAK